MWQTITGRSIAVALSMLASGVTASLAQQPAKYGGTLVFGVNSGDPPTYDCHQSTLFPIIHLLSPHYSNLLRIDLKNYPRSWAISPIAGRSPMIR